MATSLNSFSRHSIVADADGAHRRFWLLYAAAWVPFIVLYAFLVTRGGAPWPGAALASLATNVPIVLLGALVLRGSEHLSGRNSGRWAFVVVHLLLSAVFAAVWCGSIILVMLLGAPPEVLEQFMRDAVGWQFLSGMMLYAVLAGIGAAIRASRRLREQEAAVARNEALRVRAELQALRARLDPHFLFNTLHSVMALVREDRRAAEQALERFGDLLRYVLDANRDVVDEAALAEEWAFVRSYLALEQLRCGVRLRVEDRLDPESLDVAIPALTLQPLVENALRHAMPGRAAGATITVASELEGDMLRIEVRDDGAGAHDHEVEGSGGVGLRTVRQRLEARYGDRARLDVLTSPGEGFIARLTLPAATIARRNVRFDSAPAELVP